MKRVMLFLTVLSLATVTLSAEETVKPDRNIFNHLELGITAGSTGLGVDLSMPAGNFVRLRTGFTYMPHFTKNMHFGITVGDDNPALSPEENKAIQQNRFERLSTLLKGLTGYEVSNSICMQGQPQLNSFKLLADIYPFRTNKHWHVTAGFYAGPSRIAKAYNAQEDMPSLMGVAMYNSIYWKAYYEQNIFEYNGSGVELPPAISQKILEYGEMGMPIGRFKNDFYATQDMYYTHDVYDTEHYEEDGNYVLLHRRGEVQYQKGELVYRKGDMYRMIPDEDIMIKAKAFVNAFRPYLGLGYNVDLGKHGRTKLAVDCGVMMWGGSPKIVTHDGVDIAHDLTNVNGQVGNVLHVIKQFPIYPVFELRFSHDIF